MTGGRREEGGSFCQLMPSKVEATELTGDLPSMGDFAPVPSPFHVFHKVSVQQLGTQYYGGAMPGASWSCPVGFAREDFRNEKHFHPGKD